MKRLTCLVATLAACGLLQCTETKKTVSAPAPTETKTEKTLENETTTTQARTNDPFSASKEAASTGTVISPQLPGSDSENRNFVYEAIQSKVVVGFMFLNGSKTKVIAVACKNFNLFTKYLAVRKELDIMDANQIKQTISPDCNMLAPRIFKWTSIPTVTDILKNNVNPNVQTMGSVLDTEKPKGWFLNDTFFNEFQAQLIMRFNGLSASYTY